MATAVPGTKLEVLEDGDDTSLAIDEERDEGMDLIGCRSDETG